MDTKTPEKLIKMVEETHQCVHRTDGYLDALASNVRRPVFKLTITTADVLAFLAIAAYVGVEIAIRKPRRPKW